MPKGFVACSAHLTSRTPYEFGTVDHRAAPHGHRPEGGREPLEPEGPLSLQGSIFFFAVDLRSISHAQRAAS